MYGFAYVFYQGKTHSRVYLYFRLRGSGSLLLKNDTDTIFSDKRHSSFKWKSNLSDLLSCPHLSAHFANLSKYLGSKCWSNVFVLASAAMYSYFLMFPVIVSVFPSLLPRLNPQNIQNAFYAELENQKFTQWLTCLPHCFHMLSNKRSTISWLVCFSISELVTGCPVQVGRFPPLRHWWRIRLLSLNVNLDN